MARRMRIANLVNVVAMSAMLFTSGCAMVGVPEARNLDIPTPSRVDSRQRAINDRPDSVMYLPLGEDILVPEASVDESFPHDMVGPFELRGETLAGALQLILADYDISIAFETQQGLTRRITVANLRGDLGKVINQVCSLADLYCSYEDGSVTVKDAQTFTVTLPPIGTADDDDFLGNVSAGLAAILGTGAAPIVDPTTRTIVYNATQRTASIADRYFQRLRANTAMIVFETYIWEVSLNAGNSMGVDWFKLAQFGKFNTGINVNGSIGADFSNPVSIGIPTASEDFNGTTGDLIQFLSQFGAVKSISQPQITVLSGSSADLRVADTQNYVSQIATTLSEGQATTSVSTDSVDTGFTLTIGSTWDKATVYANIEIELTNVKRIDDFAFSDSGDEGSETVIQLPQTSERQLSTQIRIRPGDSVLIAGLVRENDNYDTRGLGLMKPIIPDSRTVQAENLELVILLRPRVIVYTAHNDPRYIDYVGKKHSKAAPIEGRVSEAAAGDVAPSQNIYPEASPAPDVLPMTPEPLAPIPLTAPQPVPATLPEAALPPRMPGTVSRDMAPAIAGATLPPPENSAYPVEAGGVTVYPLEP